MNLKIKVQPMDNEVLTLLESLGIIIRLLPGREQLPLKKGTSSYKTIYASSDSSGPHKLIAVTINDDIIRKLVYHNEPEEFILIDQDESAPLILLLARVGYSILEEKFKNYSIQSDDFVALEVVMNSPTLSFFTMQPGFAHVEVCGFCSDNPPSFFVTESRDIDECNINLNGYKLELERVVYEKIRNK